MTHKKTKAFTLIELLIVIAIIGILVSVVLVFIISAKDKAKKVSVQSSLNSIASAATMCRDGGGNIINGSGGSSICNPSNGINYPSISVCGSNSADTQFTATNGGTNNWQITLTTCDFEDCVGAANAYCDSNGCHFPSSGNCH